MRQDKIKSELKLIQRILLLSRIVGRSEHLAGGNFNPFEANASLDLSTNTICVAALIGDQLSGSTGSLWLDDFFKYAFTFEIVLSLWGRVLIYHSNEAPYIKGKDGRGPVSRFPQCLLPLNCLICDADLEITANTYELPKKGGGKIYCRRCTEIRTGNKGFGNESTPDYMSPYKSMRARDWGKLVSNTFYATGQIPLEQWHEVIVREKSLGQIKEAYTFFLSQYDRTYRPRYSVFHNYPTHWLTSLFFEMAQRKTVYLKRQDPYIDNGLQLEFRGLRKIEVLIPPIFSSAIEEKPISSYRQSDAIALEDFDQYLIRP